MNYDDLNVELLFEANIQEERPFVTVQMITYGHENFIVKAVSSLVEDEFQDFEIIISDDCSPDGTKTVLLDYLERYKGKAQIRYVRHRINSREGGIGHKPVFDVLSRGEIRMSMDGDDYSLPGRVKRTIELWKSLDPVPSIMVVNGKVYLEEKQIFQDGLLLEGGVYNIPLGERHYFTPGNPFDSSYPVSGSATVSSACFEEWVSTLTRPKGVFAGDALKSARAMLDKGIWFVNEPLFVYRSNIGSITHTAGNKGWAYDRLRRSKIMLSDLNLMFPDRIPSFLENKSKYWIKRTELQCILLDCPNWIWPYWWFRILLVSPEGAAIALKRRIKLVLFGNAEYSLKKTKR